VNHMVDHNLFCDQQHGFVPGHSCMTQLLVTLELWSGLLDIDVIYLDLKKLLILHCSKISANLSHENIVTHG